jgi:two-component system chemotaxis response regulator CheY
MLCDDSLLIRKQLADFLKKFSDIEVFQAANGKEAIKVFEEAEPDLVFLDVVMPILNGLECLKQMKKINPEAKVIMLSSVGTTENLKAALDLGAVDFIQKPWKEEQLERALSRLKG